MEGKEKFKLSTLLFMIRGVFIASPILFPLLVLLAVFTIVYNVFLLYLLKDATNSAVALITDESLIDRTLLLVSLYLVLYMAVKYVIEWVEGITERTYYKQADRYFRNILLYKLGKLPQEKMYDSDTYTKFEFSYTNLYMFQQLPWHLIRFLINFSLEKLLYIAIIFTFNIYIGIYLSISFVIFTLISVRIQRQAAIVHKEQAQPIREKNYFNGLVSDKKHIKETKLYRLEDTLFKRFKNKYIKVRDAYYVAIKKDSLFKELTGGINHIFGFILIVMLVWGVYKGDINVGEAILIRSASLVIIHTNTQIRWPIEQITRFVKSAPVMIEMLFPLSKVESKEMVDFNYEEFNYIYGDFETLELKHVNYQYPDVCDFQIKDLNLKINKGEIISILGYNGSGKTTTAKLLGNVLKPKSGTILFNNQDTSELEDEELFKYYGFGFQDYAKYNFSLKDNITFGDVDSNQDTTSLDKAIQQTGLQKIIDKLPSNINTILGKEYDKEGQDLSGGEWQRVILARAYMGRKQILILDEPTASIDPYEEERMLEEFNSILNGKTAILISHRISFARLADRIVMMKDGKIIEEGTHEELLVKKGYYHELFTSQKNLYESKVNNDDL